jgi:hypothetical protein
VARIIRMPSKTELPEGTVRDFADVLFWLYRKAHRPALRDISERIAKDQELDGTASPETIRRMLRGTSVPANWPTVCVVMEALCELAGMHPGTKLDWYGDNRTIFRHIEDRWHQALEYPDWYYEPAPPPPEPPPEDPWADDDPLL